LSAAEKALQQLEDTLSKESATPEEIKKQLTALRSAREKAKQELAVAQQSLREILTVRQEGQFVAMGILD
jgi:septal ring factor EnvC (AmiA/AmiB activator)